MATIKYKNAISLKEKMMPSVGTEIKGITLTEQGLAVTPMQLVNNVMRGSSPNQSPYDNGNYSEDNTFLADEKDLATAFEQTQKAKHKADKLSQKLEKSDILTDDNE